MTDVKNVLSPKADALVMPLPVFLVLPLFWTQSYPTFLLCASRVCTESYFFWGWGWGGAVMDASSRECLFLYLRAALWLQSWKGGQDWVLTISARTYNHHEMGMGGLETENVDTETDCLEVLTLKVCCMTFLVLGSSTFCSS